LALSPWLKGIKKPADLAMVGWFGPIGVAALYYMVHSFSVTGLREVWTVGSLVVFGSTIVHGLTGYPFARLYSQWEGRGDGSDSDNREEG
jgi:NhaP-type Na+/H+ or K+/H+ antiporter